MYFEDQSQETKEQGPSMPIPPPEGLVTPPMPPKEEGPIPITRIADLQQRVDNCS